MTFFYVKNDKKITPIVRSFYVILKYFLIALLMAHHISILLFVLFCIIANSFHVFSLVFSGRYFLG